MRWPALLLLALLLVPSGSAGSARDPEIVDDEPADNPDASTDIETAWLLATRDGLRFSIRTADGSDPAADGDRIYWIVFTLPETDVEAAAALGYGDDGVLRGHLTTGEDYGGLDDRGSPFVRGTPFEDAANERLLDLRADLGRPSTWSAVIPWSSVPGLAPGALLDDIRVGATRYDRRAGQWTGAEDMAEAEGPFLADVSGVAALTNGAFPILVPAWVLPLIVLGCTGVGIAAGAALARATRPKPRAVPVASSAPVRAARPPGERFQRAPGKR